MPTANRPPGPCLASDPAVEAAPPAGKLIWLVSVVLRGSSAWVGDEEELTAPSTLTGPDMSLLSSPRREGGLLLPRWRSTEMKPASGFVFLTNVCMSPPLA